MRVLLAVLVLITYFGAMIVAHKYGYRVDGKWLIPLLVTLVVLIWRDYRQHQARH